MDVSSDDAERLRPGERIPPARLPRVPDGADVAWRAPSRNASVIVFPHALSCEECAAYVHDLSTAASRFGTWAGRLIAVLPDPPAAPERWRVPAANVVLLVDPEGEARRACGIAREEAATIVADRYGQVYHVATARSMHDLPDGDQFEDWFKYLATSCPECGVPDEPGHGAWRH